MDDLAWYSGPLISLDIQVTINNVFDQRVEFFLKLSLK